MSIFSRAQNVLPQMPMPKPKGLSGTVVFGLLTVAAIIGLLLVLNWSGTTAAWSRATTLPPQVDAPAAPAPAVSAPAPGNGPAQLSAWADGVTVWAEQALIAALKLLGWMAAAVGVLGLFLHHTHGLQRFGWRLMITAATGLVGDVVFLIAVTHLIGAGMSAATTSPLPGLGR